MSDPFEGELVAALNEPTGVEATDLVPAVRREIGRRRWRRLPLLVAAASITGAFGLGVAVSSWRPAARHAGPPVVLLMDAAAPRAVYDADTAARGATNADDLNDLLRDLPVVLYRETLNSTWERESHVVEMHPDLVLIHRSAFFHSLNLEFNLGYPPFADPQADAHWHVLYRTADDKVIAFLGLVGNADPQVRFLVYSRGTGGGWPEESYRKQWVANVESRFPALKGRVSTMMISGGVDSGSFRNPDVAKEIRKSVKSLLRLPPEN